MFQKWVFEGAGDLWNIVLNFTIKIDSFSWCQEQFCTSAELSFILKLESHGITLSVCHVDRLFVGAFAAGESIFVSGVGSFPSTTASPAVREGGMRAGKDKPDACQAFGLFYFLFVVRPLFRSESFGSRSIK